MEEEINITEQRAKDVRREKKLFARFEELGVKVSVSENTVTLEADSAFNLLLVKNAVTAFNRGFDSKTSSLLLDDSYDLAVISIKDYANTTKRQAQLKGRVIGSRGMIKKRLSKETSTYIKVYGKTISIIGAYQNLNIAVEAVEMLLKGAKHDGVFSMIDRRKLEAYGSS